MNKMRVFVSRQLSKAVLAPLAQVAELDVWPSDDVPSYEKMLEHCTQADAVLCMITDKLDANLLQQCPNLTAIATMSVGYDHIDVITATERKIPVGYTPGVLVDATADLTFALLLAAARNITHADAFVRDGKWGNHNRWAPGMFLGKDLSGSTLGIIGLGEIGQAVAKRASGFNMRLIAWNRSEKYVAGVEQLPLEQVLAQSDYLSVNVALTPETKNLIDDKAISQMKNDAVLVNTARGGIVDEAALAAALQKNQLGAAGIDVFENEPVTMNNSLLALSNVVVAPHIGSATNITRNKMAALAVANLVAALSNKPMPHCVNPVVEN